MTKVIGTSVAPIGARRAPPTLATSGPGAFMTERIRPSAVAAMSVVAVAVALLLPFATPAGAQRADFLFRRPLVTAVVRGGWAVPRAQSDIFDFTTQKL